MSESTVDRKLYEIFDEAYDLYYSFATNNEPTNSPQFQAEIKKCIKLFEDCTRLVSICGLFSSNESYTELQTNDLKYLLLPFFLGKLSLKICGGSRADIIDVAEIYFGDFLKRSLNYGLYETPSNSTKSTSTDSADPLALLTHQVLQRNQKLEKYRQQKELEDQINQLKVVVKQNLIDDETKRDFYIKLLKLSVIDAQDEITSIDQEKQILVFQKTRQEMMPKEHENKKPTRHVAPPLKPIIITKDLAQKAVYGLSYPSVPTMTVAEFYDNRVREKIFPDPKSHQNTSAAQNYQEQYQSGDLERDEDIEREKKLDVDDEYELARLRARDEYKDEHRRGEGNRYNRS